MYIIQIANCIDVVIDWYAYHTLFFFWRMQTKGEIWGNWICHKKHYKKMLVAPMWPVDASIEPCIIYFKTFEVEYNSHGQWSV